MATGARTGGGPPVCSKVSAAGPSWAKAASQPPLVWASRSSTSATVLADQPCAQQPQRMPASALARRGGAVHLVTDLPRIQVPARQYRRDVAHAPRSCLPPDLYAERTR